METSWVIEILKWPSWSAIIRALAALLSRRVATVLRNVCGVTHFIVRAGSDSAKGGTDVVPVAIATERIGEHRALGDSQATAFPDQSRETNTRRPPTRGAPCRRLADVPAGHQPRAGIPRLDTQAEPVCAGRRARKPAHLVVESIDVRLIGRVLGLVGIGLADGLGAGTW